MGPIAKFVVAVAGLAGLAFFLGSWEEHGAFSEQAAAWAQAVGTVAAIAAAVWTSRAATRTAMAQSDDALFQRAIALQVLFDQVDDAVATCEAQLAKGATFSEGNFEGLVKAFDELSPSDATAGGMWLLVIQARRSLHFYLEALTAWQAPRTPESAPVERIEGQLLQHGEYLRGRAERAREVVQAFADQLDSRWRREFGGRQDY